MNSLELEKLKLDLSIKAKNGIDFIISASVIWFVIAFIWTLSYSSYDKSVLTFIVGGMILPLAFLLSKVLKTNWKVKDNPLQPLGLWLNFAQLFYFPFLVFILIKNPDYFIMTYAIITGAHLFPYAWYYNEKIYAIVAGIISIGSMVFALLLPIENMFFVPVFMSVSLLILAIVAFFSFKTKQNI